MLRRYEQWTAPEYYNTANSNFISNEEKCNKMKALESRREKLKNLLNTEKQQYAKEVEGKFPIFYTNYSTFLYKIVFLNLLNVENVVDLFVVEVCTCTSD